MIRVNAALQSYQIHIGVMDEEIQRMELKHEERRRKGRTRRRLSSTLPSTHDFKVVMMKTRVVKRKKMRKKEFMTSNLDSGDRTEVKPINENGMK